MVQLQWKDLVIIEAEKYIRFKSEENQPDLYPYPYHWLSITLSRSSRYHHHVPHFLDSSTSDLHSRLSEPWSVHNFYRTPGNTVH